jgi:drug/metabolite transporter (DMT)-like permease
VQAFNPVTVYVVSILTAMEQPTIVSTLKVLIVCAGVGIAGYGDVTFSVIGVCLQLASSVMDSIRCVTLQKVLQANHIQVGPLVTLAHVAPFTMAALALPVLFFEGPKLVNEFPKWKSGIPMVILSGLIASCLNFVVFKIIGLTSAVTTSLTGVFKDWACILLAMYLYNTVVSSTQWLGYTVAISGLLW